MDGCKNAGLPLVIPLGIQGQEDSFRLSSKLFSVSLMNEAIVNSDSKEFGERCMALFLVKNLIFCQ